MLNLSLDILFSPTATMITKVKNSTQNHWADGFIALFTVVYFSVMFEVFLELLRLAFVRKGVLIDPAVAYNADVMKILLDMAVKTVARSVMMALGGIFSINLTSGLAYLLGGRGDRAEFFYVHMIYSLPLVIISGLLQVMMLIIEVLATQLNQPVILGIGVPIICFLPMLSLYWLYLEYITLKVIFNLSSIRAALIVLWPFILLIFLICCAMGGVVVGAFKPKI